MLISNKDETDREQAIRVFYRDKLKRVLELEANSEQIDFTLPGHNYKGPGTHVIDNLINDLQPTDSVDYVAREHDVDYVLADEFQDIYEADKNFIENTSGDEGFMASTLLRLKNLIKTKDLSDKINIEFTDEERMLINDLYELRSKNIHTHKNN